MIVGELSSDYWEPDKFEHNDINYSYHSDI